MFCWVIQIRKKICFSEVHTIESALTPGDPYEWVTSSVSCPQLLLSSCRFRPAASSMDSTLLVFGLPLLLRSPIFSGHYCFSQRALSSHDVPEVWQRWLGRLCLPWCFISVFICSGPHWFVFLVIQGSHGALLQNHIWNGSVIFFQHPCLLPNFHTHV